MARWECVKLYYYHYEDPENDFGFLSVRGPNGCYERKEVKDLKETFNQLEGEGWKIEKIDPSRSLANLGRPEAVQWQEVFQLTRHID